MAHRYHEWEVDGLDFHSSPSKTMDLKPRKRGYESEWRRPLHNKMAKTQHTERENPSMVIGEDAFPDVANCNEGDVRLYWHQAAEAEQMRKVENNEALREHLAKEYGMQANNAVASIGWLVDPPGSGKSYSVLTHCKRNGPVKWCEPMERQINGPFHQLPRIQTLDVDWEAELNASMIVVPKHVVKQWQAYAEKIGVDTLVYNTEEEVLPGKTHKKQQWRHEVREQARILQNEVTEETIDNHWCENVRMPSRSVKVAVFQTMMARIHAKSSKDHILQERHRMNESTSINDEDYYRYIAHLKKCTMHRTNIFDQDTLEKDLKGLKEAFDKPPRQHFILLISEQAANEVMKTLVKRRTIVQRVVFATIWVSKCKQRILLLLCAIGRRTGLLLIASHWQPSPLQQKCSCQQQSNQPQRH